MIDRYVNNSESEVTQSCPNLRPHGLQPTRLLCPWDSLGKSTGVGCHFLLQGIFVIWKSWGKGLPYVSKKLAGGWKCRMSWLLSPSRVFPLQFRICIERFNCRRNKKQPLQRFIRTWRNLQACCLILTQYTILYQFLYSTLII